MVSRLFAGLLALLGPAATLAGQSSVWKISRGGHALYLGGTCHVLRASDFPLPAEFDEAFAASTKLYFETDIGRLTSPEMQTLVAQQGYFTDGRTLEGVLGPRTWKIVRAYCVRAGLPLETINRFKPWLFTVTVAMHELQKAGVSAEGVDLHYHAEALRAGKATGALETFERHVEFLFNLGAGQEGEMIVNSLEELTEIGQTLDAVLVAWKKGDVAGIDRLLLHDVRTRHPAIYRALFVERNATWLPKLEDLLGSSEVEFVLVGAGHLAGDEGLLAQLRARGCTVEQIGAGLARRPVGAGAVSGR